MTGLLALAAIGAYFAYKNRDEIQNLIEDSLKRPEVDRLRASVRSSIGRFKSASRRALRTVGDLEVRETEDFPSARKTA